MVDTPAIQAERIHRGNLWQALLGDGPDRVPPALLRDLRIYGGAQGVWVDKARTRDLSPSGSGVTVAVLHTGSSYADDLSTAALLYHYPSTARGAGRDAAEVEATKEAARLALPLFVILYPTPGSRVREVRRGHVQAWDDKTRTFLIRFDLGAPPEIDEDTAEGEFVLKAPGKARKSATRDVRPGQPIFKFNCLRRYGARCAVCEMAIPAALDAAHIRGVRDGGSDDARNGLILCATHHRAFDSFLFTIDPSFALTFATGFSSADLQVSRGSLNHLARKPHPEALAWRHARYLERVAEGL
jgi:putative restriction endonuclease